MNLKSCVREHTYPEKYLRLDGLIQEEADHVCCTLTIPSLLSVYNGVFYVGRGAAETVPYSLCGGYKKIKKNIDSDR